jgi:hypothetical protein
MIQITNSEKLYDPIKFTTDEKIFPFFFLAFLMIHNLSLAQIWSELGNGINALNGKKHEN